MSFGSDKFYIGKLRKKKKEPCFFVSHKVTIGNQTLFFVLQLRLGVLMFRF